MTLADDGCRLFPNDWSEEPRNEQPNNLQPEDLTRKQCLDSTQTLFPKPPQPGQAQLDQAIREIIHEPDPAEVLAPEGNRSFDLGDCAELLQSIGTDGQLVPGIVFRHPTLQGKFLCAEGNRRCYCCRVMGIMFKTVIADGEPSKSNLIKTRLTANCLREAMNHFDLCKDITDFMHEEGTTCQVEAAERFAFDEGNLKPRPRD